VSGQQFRGDGGAADAAAAAALGAYAARTGSEHAALTALAATRFLVPVVAVLTEQAADGGEKSDEKNSEKSGEMALPTLIGNDGRPAIIAFTGLDALRRWRADARPIPAEAGRVWQAAVAENSAVVVDVAGPVPFVVEGARLAALAAGRPVPRPHEDPDVHAVVEAVIATEPAIAGARLGAGEDLSVQFLVRPGDAGWEQAVRRAAAELAARLAPRFRRPPEIAAALAP
jgi:hypothetical protein